MAVLGKVIQSDRFDKNQNEYKHNGRAVECPDGYIEIFEVSKTLATHPLVYRYGLGKAISATMEAGFLCYGQYRKGYPAIPLRVLYVIQIDNNSVDDRNILILEAYDHHQDRVIGKQLVSRKDFEQANKVCLFTIDFVPKIDAEMEFRVYYMGYAYVYIAKIAVINPAVISVVSAEEIPIIENNVD
jgi:hypothetical protein